jgi:ubiquinone/menaquinone biosynthesis C-methylase UbiE
MDDRFEISELATKKWIRTEKGSPVTEREWDSYPFIFHLPKNNNEAYWHKKKILDVGSGIKFKDPSNTFPGAIVYAIDPEFQIKYHYSRIPYNSAHHKRIGVVQEIPYDDNTFDHILSSHAVPQHIYPIDLPKAISEMIRVMKPTGDIRLAPCIERDVRMEVFFRAGFVINFDQPTSEGRLAIIKCSDTIRNEIDPVRQLQLKVEAWRKLHERILPHDKIRDNFNSLEYAKSYSKLIR